MYPGNGKQSKGYASPAPGMYQGESGFDSLPLPDPPPPLEAYQGYPQQQSGPAEMYPHFQQVGPGGMHPGYPQPYGFESMGYSAYGGDSVYTVPMMPLRPAPSNHPSSRAKGGLPPGVSPAQQLEMLKRRKAPPRFQPIMIIVIVQSLGLVFVGLTMTVISNWPGYSAVGGNPLEVAGPVLLAVGGAIFFLTLAIVCLRQRKEKREWETNFATFANSRAGLMQQYQMQQQHMSMINQSVQHQQSMMMMMGQQQQQPPQLKTPLSTEPNAAGYNSSAGPPEKATPSGGKTPASQDQGSLSDRSESSGDLPTPIRPSSRSRPPSSKEPSTAAEVKTVPPRTKRDSAGTKPPTYPTSSATKGRAPYEENEDDDGGEGFFSSGNKRRSQRGVADVTGASHGSPYKPYTSSTTVVQQKGGPSPKRPPLPPPSPLHINIQAKPGTSIHITPSAGAAGRGSGLAQQQPEQKQHHPYGPPTGETEI